MTTPEDISIYFWANWVQKLWWQGTPFEGLEAINNTRPDLVLSDIKMPGMDGFELLDKIRAFGPDAGGSVPVIAMPPIFSQSDPMHTHHADFRAGLPKPFTPDEEDLK